ncbi:tetratricopeptide repeat protein [Persicimonas caeni]|uniref:Tetratricopeptide repeat protein n=1 Tax=Persicimonas caeni TaxID=2292766 RepID=A0A4Y6Q0F8_PERCE|nr:HEAT repeat domain-containing protein [Persicimonas caeni]QDG53970.1 tetratricopeptide repeat protein [Persicimonas caeni]QED35191.1 tetratricopeptide repeat protein [Persicimonas caeni]
MQRLRLKLGIMLVVLATYGTAEVITPAPVYAQDWDVKGGEKRRQEIIRRYKQLLERNPVEGLIFEKLVAYVGRGKGLDGLIDDYKKAVEAKPDKLAYRLILGHLLKTKNDYKGALEQYEKAVELDDDNPTAFLARGSAHMLLQHDKKATEDFEKALELEDDKDRKTKILRKLADVAFAQRDWERAEKYYDQLIALDKRNEYLRMEYAQVLVKYKRYEKALEQYDALIKLAGRDTKARATTLRDKGDVYERMGEPEMAVKTYRKAMKLMREGHWLHNELRHRVVDVYRGMDKLDELLEEYEKEWKYPDYDESMMLAKLYDELGKEDKALDYYQRAIKKNRRKVDPRLKVIRILQRRGEDKKVVDAYQDLIRVAPGQHRFQFELVQIYFRMGDRKKAERQLTRIARRFRRDPQVYLELADTYMRYDMRDKARKAYERLVRLDPKNESYILSLGEFYYRESELDKAKKTWKKILRSRLSKAEAHALLGETYAEHGMIDKGIEEYKKAIELAPDDLTIRRGVAINYEQARRFQQAIDAWSHIMEKAEEPEMRAEARGRIIGIYQQQGRLRSKMRDFAKAFEADEPDEESGYFLAEAHLKRKEYEEAEAVYSKLIKLDDEESKEDVEAFEALLRIYEQTGDKKKSIAVLEKMAELRPKLAREYFHRIAELSLELYQDDKAVQYAMRAVEQNPDDATAHARLGDVYREMQRLEAAAKEYRVAIDLDPRAFDHTMKLAELLMELQQYEEAEELYRTIVKKARDESLILKAGRKAMQLAEADGRLEELEMEFSPLLFSARSKPVYRKLMLELYDRVVTPLVTEMRYGMAGDRDETKKQIDKMSRQALPALTDALQSDDVGQRALAIRLLGDLHAGPAAPTLARIAVDPKSSLRSLAVMSVARIGDERASRTLIRALDSDDPTVRDLATWALGFTGGSQAVKALVDIVKEGQNWSQQALAAVSLGRIGDARSSRALLDAFDSARISRSSDNIAMAIVWALGRAESDKAVDKLTKALEEGSKEVQSLAAWSLARVGNDEALEALLDAYWSDEPQQREVAGRGLVQLAGREPEGQGAESTAREVAHDIQYINDRRHEIQTDSVLSSLRQDASAIDVTPAGDFITDHLDTFARMAKGKLEGDNARVRRIVLRDLADMSGGMGFGVLSPATDADKAAVKKLVAKLHSPLQEIAKSEESAVLRPVATLLGAVGDSGDVPKLLELAKSDDVAVREAAVSALGKMPTSKELVEAAKARLGDDSFAVRSAAAVSLGELVGAKDAQADAITKALLDTLGDDYRAVREAAAEGLVALGSDAAINGLAERLANLSLPVKLVALRALADSESEAAKKALVPYADHADMRLRRAAAGL